MTRPPAIGATVWNQTLVKGKNASRVIRQAARRIIEEQPGPQTTALLLARIGISVADIDEAFDELEKIGEKAKAARSDPLPTSPK
jgi:hypothetical protein